MLGIRIIESLHMVESVEDWSRVRSPGRARRRRRLGHRQNIVVRSVPRRDLLMIDGVMCVHPSVADALRRQMSAEMDRQMGNALMGGLYR